MVKGLEPLVSAVLVVAIVLAASSIISVWYMGFVSRSVKGEGSRIAETTECGQAALDFDSSGTGGGIRWDFSGPRETDYLEAWLVNTGPVNLYGFVFEAFVDQSDGTHIFVLQPEKDATIANPLKPGQSRLFKSKLTEDVQGELKRIRVMNGACRQAVIEKVVYSEMG